MMCVILWLVEAMLAGGPHADRPERLRRNSISTYPKNAVAVISPHHDRTSLEAHATSTNGRATTRGAVVRLLVQPYQSLCARRFNPPSWPSRIRSRTGARFDELIARVAQALARGSA